ASVIEGALAVLANAAAHQIARDAYAVHGGQPSADDRRQRRRDVVAGGLREHARERLALVGLDVDEEERRRLAMALVVDLRVERLVKERDGDEQHDAGPQRDHHARGLATRPSQAADPVPPRGPRRARKPPRRADEAARERPQRDEGGERGAEENAAELERAG